MATTYRVSFDIVINEGHPRKWIPNAVCSGLEVGEYIFNWDFQEINPTENEKPTKQQQDVKF